jgi:enoyl-CoA hydratase/carnithine racemase
MVENKYIDLDSHNNVLRIGLNRAHKKNALTGKMYDTLRLSLIEAEKNPEIKAVLFHGTADAFCAGNDLKGFDNRDPNSPSPGQKFLKVLQAFKKPVVAAVSGIAVGIGVTLLLHCDLVYATADTRFRLSFVNLGLCPEAGSSLLLTESAGIKKASEVLMLGEFFDTEKAIGLGIVNEAVLSRDLLNLATEKAEQLAQKPQQALLLIKQLLKQENQQAIVDRMDLESTFFGELLLTKASIEARAKLKNQIQKPKDS